MKRVTISDNRVEQILKSIRNVRAAVYGDFCLDAYWILDPRGGEISEETGKRAQAVKEEYVTLGGASNVVANLAALQPAEIQTIGAIGDDMFGRELLRQFHQLGVKTDAMVYQQNDFDTPVFGKRYLKDEEQPRIDFGFFNRRTPETDQHIISNIRESLKNVDVLVFNQQIPESLTDYFIELANQMFRAHNDKLIVLDTRHYGDRLDDVVRKTNHVEAARHAGYSIDPDSVEADQLEKYAAFLFSQSQKPVFITRGTEGLLTVDKSGVYSIPGLHIEGKVDPVGAGDTVTSALALSLAAHASPVEAAGVANLAAGVTVQKLFRTGTASGKEILDLVNTAVYRD